MFFLLTISIIMATLFLCTTKPTEPNNGQNIVTYKGLYGKLVDINGKAISGAKVKAFNVSNGLQKVSKGVLRSASQSDSVFTDSSGYYSFESLVAGSYNLQGDYSDGKLVVFITGVIYESAGAIMEVQSDTLLAPGQISGIVNTNTGDNSGVLCYIPGTSYLSMTDDTGGFVLSNLPKGTYRITYRKDGLKITSDTGVGIHSGKMTKLQLKNMEADPAYPPPAPLGLTVVYDTLHGCAIIQWKPVIVSDLAGYIIYRNGTGSTTPQQISKFLVKDTSYIDTVFSNVMDTNNLVFTYQIKAQDKEANLSTVYSKPFIISTPSPTKVRTFFAWKYLNTNADSASINDTVSIIVSYCNETRKNTILTWYIGTKDSVCKLVNETSFIGNDTIKYASSVAWNPKIYVSMVDASNIVWWDSTVVKIVQDVPFGNAGIDTSVSINTNVSFAGTAAQQFGTIVMYKWDFDGDGIYDDSSKITGATTHTYTHEASYNAKLLVRDDDGNEAVDDRIVSVRNTPPKIVNIRPDTLISINDSVLFYGSAIDDDGRIVQISWDFDGNGVSDYSDSTQITVGYRYLKVGIYHAILRIKDDDGKISSDTVLVTVIQDIPTLNLTSVDTVSIRDTINFKGSVIQQFGSIVKWEWDIGGIGNFYAGDSDTIIVASSFEQSKFLCILKVTDDDGNSKSDTAAIAVIRDAPAVSIGSDTGIANNEIYEFRSTTAQRFGSIVMYKWDFEGDGQYDDSSTTNPNVSHAYQSDQFYKPVLLIRDDDGNETVTTKTIAIGSPTITDADGNVYNTVRIGAKWWTVENLRTTRYNDGSSIPVANSSSDWDSVFAPRYCYYENTTNLDTILKFGALYNWYAVNTGKLAPLGWHVPSKQELDSLVAHLIANGYNWDGSLTGNKLAKAIAAKTDWPASTVAGTIGATPSLNNRTGFSGLPSGCRIDSNVPMLGGNNGYLNKGDFGYWWGSTNINDSTACLYYLGRDYPDFNVYQSRKVNGYSVRLVKD